MIESLQAKNISSLEKVQHGFFTRKGGVSEGVYASLNCGPLTQDAPEKIAQNRASVAAHFSVSPENLLTCKQVHSADVMQVTSLWSFDSQPEADALVTRMPNVVLGILTADCVPVLFADETHGIVAAAHAGWQGAIDGVISNTFSLMQEMGAMAPTTYAAIGPCIWQDSYEVDLEFMDRFLDQDELNNRFFFEADEPDKFLFELSGYVRDQIRKCGIEDISLSPADTFEKEEDFFSFRRSSVRGEEDGGRQISAIMLRA